MTKRIYRSREVQEKFNNVRISARKRGIEFLFTFEEWWAWWQTDGRWESRGRGPGKLVMARNGDIGPYATWNVHCCTWEQNQAEITRESYVRRGTKSAATRLQNNNFNLGVRGAAHPRSRPVRTPDGDFESGYLAADHYGVTKETIYWRLNRGKPGYQWLDAKARNQTKLASAAILRWEGGALSDLMKLAERCDAHGAKLTQLAFAAYDDMRLGNEGVRARLAEAADAFACAAALRCRAVNETATGKPEASE